MKGIPGLGSQLLTALQGSLILVLSRPHDALPPNIEVDRDSIASKSKNAIYSKKTGSEFYFDLSLNVSDRDLAS